MSSTLRLQWPGAVLHVTSRADNRQFIFRDDEDFEYRVHLIGRTAVDLDWGVHSYAIMGNHDHLNLELTAANVSTGVQSINGTYARYYNKKYARTGHVFEDRFGSVLVAADTHFLEVSAYVPLNPVRAGIVQIPEDYRWSSYRATAGLIHSPPWLDIAKTLSYFGGANPRAAFRTFVHSRIGKRSPFDDAVESVLGSEEFRTKVQRMINGRAVPSSVPRRDREVVLRPTLEQIVSAVCRVLMIDSRLIRVRHGREVRLLVALIAREEGALPIHVIADRISKSRAETSRSIAAARIAVLESPMKQQYADVLTEMYSGERVRLPSLASNRTRSL